MTAPLSLRKALTTEPNVIVLVECPSPQRNPVLDALPSREVRPLVVYMEVGGRGQAWGQAGLDHPHVFADRERGATWSLVRYLLSCPRSTVVVAFGVRRRPRVCALLCARLRRLPIVTRSDTNIAQIRREPRLKRLLRGVWWRTLLGRHARVWSMGEANERFWTEEMGMPNALRIPYSMPVLPGEPELTPRARRSDPDRLRFLYVGRLSGEKRVDLLLDAFRAVDSPTWRLTIVGTGGLASALAAQASEDSRTTLVGAVRHHALGRIYADHDVLVLPSDDEPWGLVVNEALGHGLWVVTSDAVGASELITSPDLGAVFPAGDVGALTEALLGAAEHLNRTPVEQADPTPAMRRDLEEMLAGEGQVPGAD